MQKTLANTDSIYCLDPTNSNQTGVFIGPTDDESIQKFVVAASDGVLKLRLNYANLFRNAVEHFAPAKEFHSRNQGIVWTLDRAWIGSVLNALDAAFKGDAEATFLAGINPQPHSRTYLTGLASLKKETDPSVKLDLRKFLFAGDTISLELIESDLADLVVCVGEPQVDLHSTTTGTKLVVDFPDLPDASSLPLQLIYYGAPGTGKSFQTDKIAKLYDDTIRVTFHPDSDYSSFVGCYKPSMTPVQRVNCIDDKAKLVKNADGTPSMTEAIVYKFVPQAFAKAYVKAWEKTAAADSPERVPLQFLVIEEINRGNCAQIFGDLFQLLDRDDNGYSKYPVDPDTDFGKHLAEVFEKLPADPATRLSIDTALADAKKKWEDVRGGRVLVLPPNLRIWATMNTSDQSLFPIDSAFKRRWGWEYVPIADADKKWAVVANKKRFDWWAFLEKANDAVREATKSEDKELGYFFVKPPAGSTDIPAKTFVDKVLFYLFGDAFKDDVPPMSLFPKKKGDSKPWTLRDFRKNVLEGGSAKSLPNEEALAEWLEQIGIKATDADETADTATAASAATDEAAAGPATEEPAES